jgi:hypothetical protein
MENARRFAIALVVIAFVAGAFYFPHLVVHGQSGSQIQGGVATGATDNQFPVDIGGADSNGKIQRAHILSDGSLQVGFGSPQTTVPVPTPISPTSSTVAASSLVLKSSAGSLYDAYATASTSAGFLMVFDAVSAPSDGTVSPKQCIPVAAGGIGSIAFNNAPESYATGIVMVFSTGANCFTKTASATAFLHGRAA